MSFIVKQTGGDFVLAPAGTHTAVCIQAIDLGTRDGGKWGPKRKLRIAWEIPGERMDDGRPMIATKQYSASLSEKS